MTATDTSEQTPRLDPIDQSGWIRLRTLVALRWLAIAGQSAAVIVANLILNVDLRLDLCGLAIAASILFNLLALWKNPSNTMLSETRVAATLIFDVSQLVALLYLTGGLSNPFSLLLLAPVTISAAALTLRSTLLVGAIVIGAITLLVPFHAPLHLKDGTLIAPPELLVGGMWASLLIGTIFLAAYARRIAVENRSMSQALSATQMALAREQQLTALGGVVAAAAHELGTPLATIKLVSTELEDELEDRADLLEDVRLIRAQSERCREILRDMGRGGRDDAMMRHAPLSAILEEAAEPHMERGKTVILRMNGTGMDMDLPDQPLIRRYPEIIHGLRNLIQNAVDFSQEHVWVDMSWTQTQISVMIGDDGKGFSPDLMGRIGEPYVGRKKRGNDPRRPSYEGMGLGLFIAKTLLERTGAALDFENSSQPGGAALKGDQLPPDYANPSGAVVTVTWARSRLEMNEDPTRKPLGENQLNAPWVPE